MTAVYRELDLAAVLSEYQPALHVPSLPAVLSEYEQRGVAARAALPHQRIEYGAHPDEWLWYVPARAADAPLFVFLHGGYWRRLSADDGCLLSEGAHAQGWAFASINYTLCPNGPLDLLVDQCRRAVDHLASGADSLGHDPHRIVISGHSAGGHLAGMIAVHDPRPAGYVMVSGVFDITPIVHTPINDDARLSPEDAERLSPMGRVVARPGVPCITTWGEQETSEFRRQSIEWAEQWAAIPQNGPATAIEAVDRHHFDVIYDLVDPSTTLGGAVSDLVSGRSAELERRHPKNSLHR